MPYKLGSKSQLKLRECQQPLQEVVELAIQITEIDFTVLEGLRSVTRQQHLVAAGASKTMRSRHLTGHAVDLAVLVDNSIRWDWPLYYKLASAVKSAAIALDTEIIWGGVWDIPLNNLSYNLEDDVADYVQRMTEKGRSAFIDGPHFELSKRKYPADLPPIEE